MTCLIVTAVVFVIIMPCFVTALEYNHYWTKLYNWFVSKINSLVHSSIKTLTYKTGPNSVSHQVRTFKEWIIIGAFCELVVVLVRLILDWTGHK